MAATLRCGRLAYGLWIEQASSVVLFGTLLSVLTLIVVMWLVQTGSLGRLAAG